MKKFVKWGVLPVLFCVSFLLVCRAPHQTFELSVLGAATFLFFVFVTEWTWGGILRSLALGAAVSVPFVLILFPETKVTFATAATALVIAGVLGGLSCIGEAPTSKSPK